MKPAIIIIFCFIVTACANKINTAYYQLSATYLQNQPSTSAPNSQRRLMIQPIQVPDFLAGNGIVMQTSPVRYVIANNHLWGSPLDQQLQQTLAINLTKKLPNWLISSENIDDDEATLSIMITSFQGNEQGGGNIQGSWTYQRGDNIIQRQFSHQLKQNEAGYDGLVAALSCGWEAVAAEIAMAIKNN